MSVQTDRQTLGQTDGFFLFFYFYIYLFFETGLQKHLWYHTDIFFVGTSPIGKKKCVDLLSPWL